MLHYLFAALAWFMKKIPKNDVFYGYTIPSLENKPYITRLLFPRIGKFRYMLHWIHSKDQDRDMHNHPWGEARTRILTGGYVEQRLVDGMAVNFLREPGSVAEIGMDTFHRITYVEPRTWTLFRAGPRVQTWGFRTPEGFVPFDEYFSARGHAYTGVKS